MDNRTTQSALQYNGDDRYYLSGLGKKIPVVTPERHVSTGTLHDRECRSNYHCMRRHYSDDRFLVLLYQVQSPQEPCF
jgi:hypothetical protein